MARSILPRDVRGAIRTGTVLQDRYEILSVLGMGGMGAVYKASDQRFPNVERFVAVKEMQTFSADPEMRQIVMQSFEREANNLASLDHPAIPKIYDYFTIQDRAYLVMEYIRGRDVETIVKKTIGFIPTDTIYEWAIELCDVLYYLHSHEPDPIVFRDIKPANIMVDQHDNLRLIDFGIAKSLEMGRKGTMIGSVGYAPPEQYQGEASPSGDIYALGATLHYLFTKCDPRIERPFTFSERPIAKYNPNISADFINVIMRALAYEKEERYVDAALMKAALLQIHPLPGADPSPTRRAKLPLGPPPEESEEAREAAAKRREDEELELVVSRSPLLKALMKAAPNVTKTALKIETYPAGTVLCRQGDPGDRVYAIWSGTLQVQYEMGAGAPPLIIGERLPGDLVGEMSLLEDKPRSATVVVLEDARMVSLSREAFLRLLGEPEVNLALLRALSQRMRASDHQLVEASRSFDFLARRFGTSMMDGSGVLARTGGTDRLRVSETQWEGLNTLFELFSRTSQDFLDGLGLLRSQLPAEIEGRAEDSLVLLRTQTRRLLDRMTRVHSWQEIENGTARLTYMPVALNTLAERLITKLTPSARMRQVELELHAAPDLPTVEGDEEWLGYALSEILDNALQYAPPESDIKVYVGVFDHKEVRISVVDRGPGVPDAYQERIFEPFVRAPNAEGSGLGLGLAIACGILQLHNGRLWLEDNADGKGSVFHMALPVDMGREPTQNM